MGNEAGPEAGIFQGKIRVTSREDSGCLFGELGLQGRRSNGSRSVLDVGWSGRERVRKQRKVDPRPRLDYPWTVSTGREVPGPQTICPTRPSSSDKRVSLFPDLCLLFLSVCTVSPSGLNTHPDRGSMVFVREEGDEAYPGAKSREVPVSRSCPRSGVSRRPSRCPDTETGWSSEVQSETVPVCPRSTGA